MTELNLDKMYEWFIIDLWTKKVSNREYLIINCGTVEHNVVATLKLRMSQPLRENIIFKIMVALGFNQDSKDVEPLKFLRRNMTFFAKPLKKYRGGNPNDFGWSVVIDTITGKKVNVVISKEKQESIKRVLDHSPDFNEAMRRLSSSDPVLVFEFGQAVGAGIMQKDGKI